MGRDDELTRLRVLLARGLQKRMGAAAIVGEPGSGKSRFLANCTLEAKLHGAIVARADAADAKGTFGVAAALAGQVLESLPALANAIGEQQRACLLSPASADALSPEAQAQFQSALHALMLEASAHRNGDRAALVGFAALTAQAEKTDVELLLRQLEHDCGHDLYMSLPSDLPKDERLITALTLAQQRFDAAPKEQRVMPPGEALPMLARAVISAIGVMGPRYDYAFFRDLKVDRALRLPVARAADRAVERRGYARARDRAVPRADRSQPRDSRTHGRA